MFDSWEQESKEENEKEWTVRKIKNWFNVNKLFSYTTLNSFHLY